MTGEECKVILDYCEENEMSCTFVTMNPTHITKNSGTVVKALEESIVGFRKPIFATQNDVNGIEFIELPLDQLCEVKVYGDYNQMKGLAEEIGVELSDSDLEILINIDKKDVQIEPETGNYQGFRYISGKAYELLTPEEKEAYDAKKEAYEAEKNKILGRNQAASIRFK